MENNNIDIKKLKQIYKDSVEYLKTQQELVDFRCKINEDVEKYKNRLKQESNFDKLERDAKKLNKKIEELNCIKMRKSSSHKMVAELFGQSYNEAGKDDKVDEFGSLTEEQIEEYFETQKQLGLLKRKTALEENRINNLVAEFKQNKEKENVKQIKQLETKVLNCGYKLIELEEIKKQKMRKFSFARIKDMLLNNIYDPVLFKGEFAEDEKNADYTAELMLWNNKLNNWLKELYSNSDISKFNTNKPSKNYPSTFEYFVKKLEEYTGKKYKKVNLVTNQTKCTTYDHYDYADDEHCVYCASLLLPENLAEAFTHSEKKQTSQKIHNFVEKHDDIILINDDNMVYYIEDYHPEWNGSKKQNDEEWRRVKNASKFNDTYREEVRKKFAKKSKTNEIDLDMMFSVPSTVYYGEKQIVGNLPPKDVADAIIDTIEYAQKLTRLSELEKIVEKQKIQEDAAKEFAELVKEM